MTYLHSALPSSLMATPLQAETELDRRAIARCTEACIEGAEACSACAQACLAASSMDEAGHLVQVHLDCADISRVTARILSRLLEPSGEVLGHQLATCAVAARHCAEECESAGSPTGCPTCVEACRLIERTATALAEKLDELGGAFSYS